MYQFSIEDFSTFAKLSINDFRDLASFTLKILPQFQESKASFCHFIFQLPTCSRVYTSFLMSLLEFAQDSTSQ